MQLLTQNADLKKSGIYGWTLPAHFTTLTNGDKFTTCPNSGACGAFCYAKNGTYMFSNVKKAHLEKLELVLYRRTEWRKMMVEELKKPKYAGKFIRVHDSGDYFNIDYALDWFDIMRASEHCTFYSYTKQVKMFKENLKGRLPANFITIFSYGGKQDHLIDRETDRHSDVFCDYDKMIAEGYVDIAADDKLAAIAENHRIGLYRNNISHYIKKMDGKRFSELSKQVKK